LGSSFHVFSMASQPNSPQRAMSASQRHPVLVDKDSSSQPQSTSQSSVGSGDLDTYTECCTQAKYFILLISYGKHPCLEKKSLKVTYTNEN
jgi:hypothetical protein